MLSNVDVSGVVFTRDLKNGTPYFSINYDDFTGKTDTVTGGAESKSIYVIPHKSNQLKSKRFRKLIILIKKIINYTENESLDIEFCFKDEKIYILQVRRLISNKSWVKINKEIFLKN